MMALSAVYFQQWYFSFLLTDVQSNFSLGLAYKAAEHYG